MLNEIQPVVSGLQAADRSLQKEKGRSLLLRACPWLLGLILLCFLLDVFLHLSSAWRIGLLAGLAVGCLSVLGWSYYVTKVRRNQLERMARLLETRDPQLGSKLINILQLEAQTSDPALGELTRQMARQAIAGYAGQLQNIDFAGLARTGRLAKDLRKTALGGVAFVAVMGVFYQISGIEILRFADPLGDHPPYSFTRLEIVDPGEAGAQVVYNKSLVVKVKSSGHRPGELFLTYQLPNHPEQAVTVPMFDKGSLGFYQEIGNIKSDLIFFAHTKNLHSRSKQRHLEVLLTPRLERALAQISPPAYTGIKAEEKPYDFKTLRALNGSRMQFRLQSNRPLRKGDLEVITSTTDIQHVAMTKSAENEVTAVFDAKDSARLKFSLVDADGIPSEDSWEGSLVVTHDLPPEIHIVNPKQDCFVAFNFKTEMQIEANDDYGVKTMRIHRALNQVYSPPKVITYDKIILNARESTLFNFADLGVKPGDVISVFAEAIDTAPEANLARSETINLTVISEEDYNGFLREQNDISDIEGKYTDLLDQVRDLTDEQKKLSEAAEELQQKLSKADDKQKAALQPSLDKLLAQQNELNSKLQKTADQMEHFVRDKPLYDVEADFQKMLKQKAQDIRNSTATNNQSANDVARRSSPGGGRRQLDQKMVEDFKKASDEQVSRLNDAELEARQEVSQTVEDMSQMQEVLKDFNRFSDLYQTQQALADQARAYNRSGPQGREDQLALKNLAETEKDVADQLKDLEKKLRDDSQNAAKLFPKASQSASDLADKMKQARMNRLAQQATDKMLGGQGDDAFQLSDRLRSEMEKLFSECHSKSGQQSEELDAYLKLQRKLSPGNSFAQMMQSHKFGNGNGKGQMSGMMGNGARGSSGYAVMEGPSMSVMGNETFSEKGNPRQSGGNGRSREQSNPKNQSAAYEKPDAIKDIKPVNRKSDAVTPESTVDQYSDIVDKYFKAISK